MPLDEFVGEVWRRLQSGEDQIAVGSANDIYEAFETKRQSLYADMTAMLNGLLKQFLV